MREFSISTSLRNGTWITLLAVVVLALSGPFGTYDVFDLGNRFLFWGAAMIAGTAFIQASVVMAIKLGPDTKRATYAAAIIGTLFGSVPATAVIMIIYEWFSDLDLSISYFPLLWTNVALVGCIVSCGHVFAQLGGRRSEKAERASVENEEPLTIQYVPLLSRLPDGLRPCQVMSFSMQDHYVEVTTTESKTLLLMRLSDAIKETGDYAGARTHRSHWVSERHLVDIKRAGRKFVAILTDDRQVPISAPYLEDVRELLERKNAAR